MATSQQFRNMGDKLIKRSIGRFGQFKMPKCTEIITLEARRDGWFPLQEIDVLRILARYKDHVSYWNIPVQHIRAEIEGFAVAVNNGHTYQNMAETFDRLRPMKHKNCKVVFNFEGQYAGKDRTDWSRELLIYLRQDSGIKIAPVLLDGDLEFSGLDEDDKEWADIKNLCVRFATANGLKYADFFRTLKLKTSRF